MPEQSRGDERAVSELVGYIFVFSLVFLTIGAVSLGGFPTLDDAREREQTQNAERAFDVLDSNMAEVYERGAPSRSTEINAEDANVLTEEPVTFTVSTTDTGGHTETTEIQSEAIVFSGEAETEFVYQAGAVIRDDPDNPRMLREPPFNTSDKRTMISLVELDSSGPQTAGGGGVLVRAESSSSQRSWAVADTSTDTTEVDEMEITVEDSPREEVWKEYFETELGLDCDTGNDLECDTTDLGTQTFVVVNEIDIELER